MVLQNAFENLSTESKQDDIILALGALLTELGQKLEAGQAIALDTATLTALENITTTIGNLPADYPDDTAATLLAAIQAVLEGTLTIDGTVALDVGSLAALEFINAIVQNWPSEYPLPTAQLDALTPQTDALTDIELRASDVDVADSGEREYTHVTATVTASGDTTIYTPASGKKVRLRWIYAINNPASSSPPRIIVKLGADEIYRVWALSKRQKKTGPVDGALIINLNGTGDVAVTAILEEVS